MNQGLSHNIHLKGYIEKVFGHKAFLKIKEFPTLNTWKNALELLIRSYDKAIIQSIQVAPPSFYNEIKQAIDCQRKFALMHDNEEELFSSMVVFQSELLFLLLGNITTKSNKDFDLCGWNRH